MRHPLPRRRFRPVAVSGLAVVTLLLAGCSGGLDDVEKRQNAAEKSAEARAEAQERDWSALPTPPAEPEFPAPPTAGTGGSGTGAPQPSTTSPRPPTVTLPDPKAVTMTDSAAVAKAALTVMFSYDVTVDTSRRDAQLRAAPYLTADYLDVLRTPTRPFQDVNWQTWVEHRAHTAPRIELAEEALGYSRDQATTSSRSFSVTVLAEGEDGWTGLGDEVAVFVTLTRAGPGTPWLVSNTELQ